MRKPYIIMVLLAVLIGWFFVPQGAETANKQMRQAAYRWFNNLDSTDVGSPLAAENTAAAIPQGSSATARLRVAFTIPSAIPANQGRWKLQVALRSGTCDTGFSGESYSDVLGTAGPIVFHNNPTPSDGAAATANSNDPDLSPIEKVMQTYEEENGESNFFDNTSGFGGSKYAVWDFALADNNAPGGNTYCFRVVTENNELLDGGYAVIPELAIGADTTPPTISALSPADNATDVAVTTNLVITFSEPVDAEAGANNNITIYRSSDDSVFETIDAQASNVTGSGTNTITINPAGTLANSTAYYVQIGADAFDDAAGNSYAGISDKTTWNFTTIASGDSTAPTVSSFSPPDNSSNVGVGDNLVITFSENVFAQTGNIEIRSGNSVVETIDVNDASKVTISGAVVTINPAQNLAYGTDYSVRIAATAFADASGNNYSGISDDTTWNFTTTVGGGTGTGRGEATGRKPVIKQSGFRWFDNDNSVKVGVPMAELNQPTRAFPKNIPQRLRLLLHVDNFPLKQSGQSFKLQYAEKSGNCDAGFAGEIYKDILTPDGDVRFYDNSSPADDFPLTANANDPTHGSDPIVSQTYEEENNFTNSIAAIPSGSDGLWDFPLVVKADKDVSYCFRAVKADGSLLDNYSQIPELKASAAVAIKAVPVSKKVEDVGDFQKTIDNAKEDLSKLTPRPADVIEKIGVKKAAVFEGDTAFEKLPVKFGKNSTFVATDTIAFSSSNAGLVFGGGDDGSFSIYDANDANDTVGKNSLLKIKDKGAAADVYITGRLGIGTENPVADLDVQGNVTFNEARQRSGYFRVKGSTASGRDNVFTVDIDNGFVGFGTANPRHRVDFISDDFLYETSAVFSDISGGPVRAYRTAGGSEYNPTLVDAGEIIGKFLFQGYDGTGDPALGTDYKGGFKDAALIQAVVDGTPGANIMPGRLEFYTTPADSSTLLERMRITAAGNIGIGTATPDFKLDVSGSIRIEGGNSLLFGGTGPTDADVSLFRSAANVLETNSQLVIGGGARLPGITNCDRLGTDSNGNIICTAVSDTTPPTISSLSPADDSNGVLVDTNLTITFSEAVTAQTGNIVIKKSSNNSIAETISVTSGAVTGSGTSVITINPASDLDASTSYYINIDAGAFKDSAGNSFAGISDATTWNFTTGNPVVSDTTPPTISALSPPDDAVNVNRNTALTIKFSENVQIGTGNITIFLGSNDAVFRTINVASSAVSGSGTDTITVTLTQRLAGRTDYYINIDAGAFKDLAGNSFAGISGPTAWNFTTR